MRIIQWALIIIIGVAILFISMEFLWRETNCKAEGWERNAALEHADEKLKVTFESPAYSFDEKVALEDFVLVNEQFSYGLWSFSYRAKDCFVDIIIDKCGISDIGGMSDACIPPKK